MNSNLRIAIVTVAMLVANASSHAQLPQRLIDPEDGMLDLSEHLLAHSGMLPVPIVITEPAVGNGLGLMGLFFDQPLGSTLKTQLGDTGKAITPNVTGIGGFKTENGSWGAFAGHYHSWQRDRYRYLGGLGQVEMQLDYYGPLDKPRSYQLQGLGLFQQLMVRAADTDWFFGARYAWMQTQPSFADGWPSDLEGKALPTLRIGRLSLVVDHDTRSNAFSPTSGHFIEAELALARPELGGSGSFEQFNLRGFNWQPLGSEWVVGLRGDLKSSRGDIPFFSKPFVVLRGVPALRYQDDSALVGEAELWWRFSRRWSVLGFAGAGRAWGRRTDFGEAPSVTATGGGFRYLVAQKLGIQAGLDVARGPQGYVVYLQVGSPWR